MNNISKVIIGIIALLVILGGAFIFLKPDKSSAPGTNNSSQKPDTSADDTANSANSANTPDNKPAAVTVTYNGSSFSLSADTIKAGESIKVVNSSTKDLDFDSDPHPVHTDNPELNLGSIAPGESKSATLSTKGHWGFHNHLNSSQHGNITVQ
jgi:cytoskeletal protein RodZ